MLKTDKNMKSLTLAFILLLLQNCYTQNFWQPLNGPYAGVFITQISTSPSGNLFLSTLGGGIYRSSDNGNTWLAKINSFPGPIYDDGTVIFAFNTSGHIFATSFTNGLWRSTNNGDNWLQVDSTIRFIVAAGINQAGHIFVSHGGGGGIYRSTNNGDNFTAVNNGLPQPFTARSILCKPGGPIFAGGSNYTGPCVYISSNNGDSWNSSPLLNIYLSSLASNSNGDIFAGTHSGVFRSSNNGNNWIQINNGLSCLRINNVFCANMGVVMAASDSGLFRSSDNGSNWQKIGFNNKIVSTVLALQNGSYFAGDPKVGVYRSTNNGSSWLEINNGINSALIYSLAINQSGNIFAGSEGKLILTSTDNGNTWQQSQNGLKGNRINTLECAPNNYLFACSDSGVFRSTNNGTSWIQVFGSLIPLNNFVFKQNGQIFASGSYPGFGVWTSTNNGANWSNTNMNFTASVYSLAINQTGYLFAGTSGGGIYRSTDNGSNWVHYGLSGTVHAIDIAPNGNIFACFKNVYPENDGIYRSSDNGLNWMYTGQDLGSVTKIKINSSGHIYVSSIYIGVYRSTNNGNNWSRVYSGMFNNMILSMAFNQQGYLFAATWGNGIYRSVNPTIGIQKISTEIPVNYELQQNFPNPFNPVTNIKFAVSKSSYIKLEVFDITGRVICTLVNEQLDPGKYFVDWNAVNYSSGIYFYRLIARDISLTCKMILIK